MVYLLLMSWHTKVPFSQPLLKKTPSKLSFGMSNWSLSFSPLFQHLCLIKILNRWGIERNALKPIMSIYEKPIASIRVHFILKIWNIPPKIRNKIRVFNLTTFIKHFIRVYRHYNQTRKGNKINLAWKGRSLYWDDMFAYKI